MTLHDIARLQAELFYLVVGNIDIIGRRQIVIVASTEEAIAVRHHFENSVRLDKV